MWDGIFGGGPFKEWYLNQDRGEVLVEEKEKFAIT